MEIRDRTSDLVFGSFLMLCFIRVIKISYYKHNSYEDSLELVLDSKVLRKR